MRRRGFSLAELTVSLSLLAIVMAVAIPSAQHTARRQREDALRQSLRVVREAVRAAQEDVDALPLTLNDLTRAAAPAELNYFDEGTRAPDFPQRWRGPYLNDLPRDPITGGSFQLVFDTDTYQWAVRSSAPGTDLKGIPYTSY